MKRFVMTLTVCAGLLFMGCVTPPPKPDYSAFFDHQPRSILVVPPANQTTAVDAPAIFLTTLSAAFAERGYYVFPVSLVQDILNDLGATDEGAVAAVQPEQFKEVFGADSILYVTITHWATTYILLNSQVTVGAEYRLVDADTGAVLWKGQQVVVRSSGGGGGGLAGLIVMAVDAALTAATVPYRPLALQANHMIVNQSGYGLPFGPYHPEFQQDQEKYK